MVGTPTAPPELSSVRIRGSYWLPAPAPLWFLRPPLCPRRLRSPFVSVFPFRTGKAGLIFTAPEGAVGNRRRLAVLFSVNQEAGNGKDGLKWFPHPPFSPSGPRHPSEGGWRLAQSCLERNKVAQTFSRSWGWRKEVSAGGASGKSSTILLSVWETVILGCYGGGVRGVSPVAGMEY